MENVIIKEETFDEILATLLKNIAHVNSFFNLSLKTYLKACHTIT
jgi:hypothetical protein